MDKSRTINTQLANLGALEAIGQALAAYAEAISAGGRFELSDTGSRWILHPDNFVTLEPHWKRVKNIRISLRGLPTEFAELPELPLKSGMAGYSECSVTKAGQLAAAASYIRRANELYRRGRGRTRKRPHVVEK